MLAHSRRDRHHGDGRSAAEQFSALHVSLVAKLQRRPVPPPPSSPKITGQYISPRLFAGTTEQGVFPNVSGGSPPIDFSLQYHLFAMEWTESHIRWFVDDVHVFTRVRGQPSSLFLPPVPMYLILNTAVAYWFKLPPAWTEEVFFRVDWVRVYERVHVAQ